MKKLFDKNKKIYEEIAKDFANGQANKPHIPDEFYDRAVVKEFRPDEIGYDWTTWFDRGRITQFYYDDEIEYGYILYFNPYNGKYYFGKTEKTKEIVAAKVEENRIRREKEEKLVEDIEATFGCDIETVYTKLKGIYKENGMELPFEDDDDEYEEEYEESVADEVLNDEPRMSFVAPPVKPAPAPVRKRSFFPDRPGNCEILHVKQKVD